MPPCGPAGVGTHKKTKSARDAASAEPQTKESPPESSPAVTNSSSPGSRMGVSPRCSPMIRGSSMSVHTTWWPIRARQAAVVRPTYPAPMTATAAGAGRTPPAGDIADGFRSTTGLAFRWTAQDGDGPRIRSARLGQDQAGTGTDPATNQRACTRRTPNWCQARSGLTGGHRSEI